MIKDIELAQYLNAKFCHELAGTLGAISNGVEFLEESNGAMQQKAVELVKVSAKQAISRLMFYRQAYGIAKSQGEADLKEFKKLTDDFLESTKVKLDFNEKYMHVPNVFIDINTSKLLYCFVVIAMGNLIHGGVIRLAVEASGSGKKIIFSALGDNLKNDEEKSSILKGKFENIIISTTNIHTYYTRQLAEKLNAKIVINVSDKQIDYIIEQS
jgi:histidine phosphotransferase ChpT